MYRYDVTFHAAEAGLVGHCIVSDRLSDLLQLQHLWPIRRQRFARTVRNIAAADQDSGSHIARKLLACNTCVICVCLVYLLDPTN